MSSMLWEFHHLLRILGMGKLFTITILLGSSCWFQPGYQQVSGAVWILPFWQPSCFEVNGRLFILRLLIIESSFRHGSCNPAHIPGASLIQCLTVYVLLEHTPFSHLIRQMLSPCSHNYGNPPFWKSRGFSLIPSATPSSSPWFNDELLFRNSPP